MSWIGSFVKVLAIQIQLKDTILAFDTDTDSKKCLDPVSIDTVSRYSTALMNRSPTAYVPNHPAKYLLLRLPLI